MPLTINTNISSLIAQRNMDSATNALNRSIEKMTTGYTINHASDNAAGYSINNMWVTQIGSLDVASDNAATGADMLTTAEETYSLLTTHLQRIRDLTEQASNGTYGSASKKSIQSEIHARLQEISRIAANSEFNGIKLMSYTADGDGSGLTSNGIDLQVGLYSTESSRINLAVGLFKNASVSGLFSSLLTKALSGEKTLQQLFNKATSTGTFSGNINLDNNLQIFAAACSGLVYTAKTETEPAKMTLQEETGYESREMLKFIDAAIDDISGRVTQIGAAQNRVTSAITALDVQTQNLTSSLSTLRDTDIAKESSTYLQAQILQQASATLLSTANQLPSIALNLI